MTELSILGALDTLVLERTPKGFFRPKGTPPAWFQTMVPPAIPEGRDFDIGDVFPFFDLFLPEAEAAWNADPPRRLDSSGFTQILPRGTELHLVGTALRVEGASLLLVMPNERLFQEERALLQRARELRFAHDALGREIEQKEVLAHCVVHDLRNPLSAILGALAMLEQRPFAIADAKLLGIAQRAARRQEELIRDVLATFSAEHGLGARAPSGQPPWSDIGSVVTQVASVLEPAALARGVSIETVVVADAARASAKPRGALVTEGVIVEVAADELRLFRVIGNFMENALRYSPAGGVVRIRVDDEGDFIVVRVEDQGHGVPPALVPHLFKKFARAGDGTPGTGLGLYFCRITVEAWGGGVGYEPRPEGGSRFWFRLPKRGGNG